MKRPQDPATRLRDTLSLLALSMLELSKSAGFAPLWNEGGDGFESVERARSILNTRSVDIEVLRPAVEACLAVMTGIADTAGDVPEWNAGGDAYEATHFARAVLSSLFAIDTGSRWFSVPLKPGAKCFDLAQLLAEGYQRAEITEHDTRALVSDVALQIRKGVESDPEFSEFALEWVHATQGGERWPEEAKIVVTVEQGGSEGWYLEIYALTLNEARIETSPPWNARRLISAKCFEKARMWRLAEKTSAWLGLM